MEIGELHDQLRQEAAAAIVIERIDDDEHRRSIADTLLLEQLRRLEGGRCRQPSGEQHHHRVGLLAGGEDRLSSGRDADRLVPKPRHVGRERIDHRGIGMGHDHPIDTRGGGGMREDVEHSA